MIEADHQDTGITSSRKLFLITPHDTNPLPSVCWKGVHVGATEGVIVGYIVDDPSTLVTLPVAARTHYPYAFSRITTASTATSLHGCT